MGCVEKKMRMQIMDLNEVLQNLSSVSIISRYVKLPLANARLLFKF
ncbi:hypothetical protein ZONE111904_19955 [Zobellia nedashkovskayae]